MSENPLQEILDDYIKLPEYIGFEQIFVNTKSNFGDYPIHVAAVRGDNLAIKILLENGADINIKGEHGYTPLHSAVEQEHSDTVKLLLKLGADKTIKNDNGITPLDLAAIFEYKDIIQILQG